jgi:hypothetical protein
VAEKVTRDHHVLGPKNTYKVRVSYIPNVPRDPLFEPRFDFGLIAFPIEHLNHLSLAQSFKNRSTDQLGGIGSVNAFLGEAQHILRDIHRLQKHF